MSFTDLPNEIYGEILSSLPTYHFIGILTVSKEIRSNVLKAIKPFRTLQGIKEAIKNVDLLRIILHVNISHKVFVLQRLFSQGSLECLKLLRSDLFIPSSVTEERLYKKKLLGKAFLSGRTDSVEYIRQISPSLFERIDYTMAEYISIACMRGCLHLRKQKKDEAPLINLLPCGAILASSYFPMDYAMMRESDWEALQNLDFFSIPDDPDFMEEDLYRMARMAMKREDSRFFCSFLSSLIEKKERVLRTIIKKIHTCKSIESIKYFLSRIYEIKKGLPLLRNAYEVYIDRSHPHILLIREFLINQNPILLICKSKKNGLKWRQ